jgi:hypothetical protein
MNAPSAFYIHWATWTKAWQQTVCFWLFLASVIGTIAELGRPMPVECRLSGHTINRICSVNAPFLTLSGGDAFKHGVLAINLN